MNPISIMQGRLSPSEGDCFQFFPSDWQQEFSTAKEMGFDGVCWFLDLDKANFDPIRDIWEDQEVLVKVDQATKILPIRGIDTGRYGFFGPTTVDTVVIFQTLLPALASRLTGSVISVPLLEDKFPHLDNEIKETITNIRVIANIADKLNLRLALETEWSVDKIIEFLDSLNCKNVGVCYDIGNATSYGLDCPTEIRELGGKIFDVHLKDRQVAKTQSLMLGTGDADFPACFKSLKDIDYTGGFTLQAWRGENYLADAKNQLTFVKKCLSSL